jgi:hypothetical protein
MFHQFDSQVVNVDSDSVKERHHDFNAPRAIV